MPAAGSVRELAMSVMGGASFTASSIFWRDAVTTPTRFNESRTEGRLEAHPCAEATYFYGQPRRSQRRRKAMNVEENNALAHTAAPLESWPVRHTSADLLQSALVSTVCA